MRAYNRFIVDQEIECVINGERDFVTLYDLSCAGCMIETANTHAREGCAVTVMLKDLGSVHGTVVWRIDRNAGIKFEVLLNQKLVEYCGFLSGQTAFDQHDPRDRFGSSLIATPPNIDRPSPLDSPLREPPQSMCFSPTRK